MTSPLDSRDDSPIDLSALDPDRGDDAAERFASAVSRRIAALPLREPVTLGPLWAIAAYARPIAIAAALLLLVGAVAANRRSTARPPESVAESIGVPPQFSLAARSAPGTEGPR